jgi:outer membrane protein assembly factor BamB
MFGNGLLRWWGRPEPASSIVFVRRPAVESGRFDTLVRSLGRPATRRTTLRQAGGVVAAVVAAGVAPGLAARRRKRGKRPGQGPGQGPEASPCHAATDCGSGEACLGGSCVRIVVPISATAPGAVTSPYGVAARGGNLCVTDVTGDDHAWIFRVSNTGQPTRTGQTTDRYRFAQGAAFDASGHLYVASLAGVRVYAIGGDGNGHRLADVPNLPDGASGVAADGRLLFVASDQPGVVRTFRIVASDPPTYALLSTLDGYKEPVQLAAADGRLYVADNHDDRVAVYGIDAASGQATFQRAIPVLNPTGVAAAGDQLFIASEVGSKVYGYTLAANGTPTLATVLTQSTQKFKEPHGLALSGDFLFVADNPSAQVFVFRLL